MIIARKFEFDAGHRVLGHESKCAHLHGHRYVAIVWVKAPRLDELGRVIDFSCLKELIGNWIDKVWDHNMILHSDDPILKVLHDGNDWCGSSNPLHKGLDTYREFLFGNKPPAILHEQNPTAENMARILFGVCADLVPEPLEVVKVRLYETPNCFADCSSVLD